jgi:hypothetical protein
MSQIIQRVRAFPALLRVFLLSLPPLGAFPASAHAERVFNVRDLGATGRKEDDARVAIQKTIDACATAGGGVVLFPPGLYTSGTLHLRSHVHVELASGATLFASTDPAAYDYGPIVAKAALFQGEDLDDVGLQGAGIVDGQAQYEWRPDDFEEGFDHKTMMQKLGKSLMRTFPKDFPKQQVLPHLVWLGRCQHVRIEGLNFLHSPSWTFALYACRDVSFERAYIYTSLKEAVWADGIDLDGCRDVSIANCSIETGDDCVALVSESTWGPALVCENISVTNCRLSSASAGVKFSEGNRAGIRNIRVRNCLFNNVNRAAALITAQGGSISDVVFSDLTIDCRRFDWFWAGDAQPFRGRGLRLRDLDPAAPKETEPPAATIRGLTLSNIVAHAQGCTMFHGHPECWLDGVTLENVKLYVSTDPAAPYDTAEHALDFRRVTNLRLKNVEAVWEQPFLSTWKSPLYLEEIRGLEIDVFSAGPAQPGLPIIDLRQVSGASIRHARALPGTDVFAQVAGPASRDIRFEDNDFTQAKVPYALAPDVSVTAVQGADKPRTPALPPR